MKKTLGVILGIICAVVLIIFGMKVISTYNQTTKNKQVPPKNKVKIKRKLINIDKVADMKSTTFNFYKNEI